MDSIQKKVTCLQQLQTTLQLETLRPLVGRSEQVCQLPPHRGAYDLALVRAVGTASVCAEYALPLLRERGGAILYRGDNGRGKIPLP
ncbi:hypothetical protein DO97_08650 [Neosynechococcus sphagnicola sy1]|uniref:Glucose-inhibited division protein B n=1 Tax=Neosynechococcus sphagnicola sy1 TaxID=1497020 RepID=A0A098TKR2_9CYAN|nr:hypothetical protein DO97_08650 [Neosynechococcus sphagnicola sy1]